MRSTCLTVYIKLLFTAYLTCTNAQYNNHAAFRNNFFIHHPYEPNTSGLNAKCSVSGEIFSCTRLIGFEGVPPISCNIRNPCEPNPCGIYADCYARGKAHVCIDPNGYRPNEYQAVGGHTPIDPCTRGAPFPCGTDARGHTPVDPCTPYPCGTDARCKKDGENHTCYCPESYTGNPKILCTPVAQTRVLGGRRWRDDSRCGANFKAPNGQVAECDPNSTNPCCSSWGYCGLGLEENCTCDNCSDFRLSAAVCPGGCGHGKCTSPKICTCAQGYTGSACETAVCPGGCGHGKCTSPNRCTCDQEYTGLACETAFCPGGCGHGICTSPKICTCAKGYTGSACETAVCPGGCRHGKCISPKMCICNQGYRGSACDIEVCPGGCCHGKFTSPKRCTCDQGYTGSACETAVCPGGCGHGKCTSPKRCTCDQGYTGPACETVVCPGGCGNGNCTSPKRCTCDQGYTGSACETVPAACSEDKGFLRVPKSGNQCIKILDHNSRNWTASNKACKDEGLQLAKPVDPIAMRNFILEKLGDGRYFWIGAKGSASGVIWLDSSKLLNSNPAWYPGFPDGRETNPDWCVKLMTTKIDLGQHPERPYILQSCSIEAHTFAMCESTEARNHNARRWRDDLRCGAKKDPQGEFKNFRAPNGQVAECDPDSSKPCCSSWGYCGLDADGSGWQHCTCDTCSDFRRS